MSGFTGAGTAMSLNAPTQMSDYGATGSVTMATTGPTYTVSANRNYKVQISAAAASFTGPYAKPAGDLSWSNAAAGTFTALSTTATDMTSGGPTTGSAVVGVFYKTAYNIATDVPGSYTLDVKFTLVAP